MSEETETTQELMTVAEYIKTRSIKTPQVINGWVRNQGAPAVYIEGKRMIPVAEFDKWVAEKENTPTERKGGRGTKAETTQKRTSVEKGSMLVHNSKAGVVVKTVHKITEFLAFSQTSRGKGIIGSLPIGWDDLASVIRKGEMAVVNPELVVDLVISHYDYLLEEGKITEAAHETVVTHLANARELMEDETQKREEKEESGRDEQ